MTETQRLELQEIADYHRERSTHYDEAASDLQITANMMKDNGTVNPFIAESLVKYQGRATKHRRWRNMVEWAINELANARIDRAGRNV